MDSKPWLQHYDEGVPHTLELQPAPLTALLDAAAEAFPGTAAISFYGRTLSYRELREEVRRFARGLRAAGVAPGERVLLLLPNIPQAVICYYGALMAGA